LTTDVCHSIPIGADALAWATAEPARELAVAEVPRN
jgi:hypothetical protein